jgi:xanthine dehydrogenase large subunit
VGVSRKHESAHLHVAGEAAYIDDLPELEGTLHCALGLSPVAHGRLTALALEAVRAMPEVVDVITAADIPGVNDCGSIIHDDPILCDGEIRYVGQPLFAVIARSRDAARRAAALAKAATISELPPVLTPRKAHELGQYVMPPMHLERSTREGGARAAMDAAPHRLKGSFDVGGQEQFYLEGQISYATPKEDGAVHIHCSTQHPSEMQHLVAHAWAWLRTACMWNAGAWAAASAARSRSRRCSPAWRPWRPPGCKSRSSCAWTATTTS